MAVDRSPAHPVLAALFCSVALAFHLARPVCMAILLRRLALPAHLAPLALSGLVAALVLRTLNARPGRLALLLALSFLLAPQPLIVIADPAAAAARLALSLMALATDWSTTGARLVLAVPTRPRRPLQLASPALLLARPTNILLALAPPPPLLCACPAPPRVRAPLAST